MFSNYLRVAFRNLLKHRIYSAINIGGFAVGLAATILIVLYIRFETNFDSFHRNIENIYRVSFISMKEGISQGESPQFTPPFAPTAAREIADVSSFVRLSSPRVAYASINGESFKMTNIRHADSTFFDFFSFSLISGDARQALKNPYSLVLTRSVAKRLFGERDPLGSSLRLDGKGPYLITGVTADSPSNSSIQYSALISFSTLYEDKGLYLDWNGGNQYIAYLELAPGARTADVTKQCRDMMWRYLNKDLARVGVEDIPVLHPLRDVHLHHDPGSDSLRNNVAIFSVVAFFVLILACVNFINLTTARSIRRAKEVGIRKTFGAGKYDIMLQFLGEAFLVTLFGLIIAAILVEVIMPWYRGLVGVRIESFASFSFSEIFQSIFVLFIVTIGAGAYPAFLLSRLQPALLQGGSSRGKTRNTLRNILVAFQFAVSIGLIICTLLVGAQLRFMRNMDLGFREENMIVLSLRDDEVQEQANVLRQELSFLPGVIGVTASSEVPSTGFTSNGYFPQGHSTPMYIHVVDIDDQFIDTYGLTVLQGRGFSAERQADEDSYVINESLASALGWDNPVGKTIRRGGDHPIIGVVRDFHYASLHEAIEPLIMTHRPWRGRYSVLSLQAGPSDMNTLLNGIRSVWSRVVPSSPFEFEFLDQRIEASYRAEQRFQQLFFSFSFLAIVIALMGLLGLASFSTELRTKEIGIRKVLGASAQGVVGLLSKDFIKLVAAANLVAWPAAYYFMNRWLENYAYRTDMPWELFIVAGGGVLLLALVVISAQAVKAANTNPVDALRYE